MSIKTLASISLHFSVSFQFSSVGAWRLGFCVSRWVCWILVVVSLVSKVKLCVSVLVIFLVVVELSRVLGLLGVINPIARWSRRRDRFFGAAASVE